MVKTLVAEQTLPLSGRTLRPLDVDTQGTGGVRFSVKGQFFRFAADNNGMYGGHHYAAKAAGMLGGGLGNAGTHRPVWASNAPGNELKALQAMTEAGVKGVNAPLLATVDYLGNRVIASSHIPISEQTRIYGR